MTKMDPDVLKRLRTGFKSFLHVLGFVIAACSVILAVIDAVRAVNPSLLINHHGFLKVIFNFYPVVPALILGIVGFLFAFGSKILSGSARRSHLMTASILMSILGILLSGASFTITHIFPEGMIHDSTAETSPLSNSDEVTERLTWAFGDCDSGWTTVDTEKYQGVSSVNTCASANVLFIAYDSTTSAKLYNDRIRSKATTYLESEIGGTLGEHQYASLSGDQWMIVGPGKGIKKLHSLWGGEVEWFEQSAESGEK